MKAAKAILAVILVGQATACLTNLDCPLGWACAEDNQCRPRLQDDTYRIAKTCNFDFECPSGTWCDTKLEACVKPGPRRIQDDTYRIAKTCNHDFECPSRMLCHPELGECFDPFGLVRN